MSGYLITYPEYRVVSGERLILWAQDDIANGASDMFDSPEEVTTVGQAVQVLHDSGSVTVNLS